VYVHTCTKMHCYFLLNVNMGPHSCIGGASNYLAPALDRVSALEYTAVKIRIISGNSRSLRNNGLYFVLLISEHATAHVQDLIVQFKSTIPTQIIYVILFTSCIACRQPASYPWGIACRQLPS